jgi:hypothetical protein
MMGLGASQGATGVWRLDYTYETTPGAMNNNGNVLSQKITVPTGGSPLVLFQSYLYDGVNRLLEARENLDSPTGAQQWKQRFTYDPFGNRRFDQSQTTMNVLGPNPQISQANNRISDVGYSYDSAGRSVATLQKTEAMADIVAIAKSGKSAVVQEVTTGANKPVSRIRKQLEAGFDHAVNQRYCGQ